MMEKVKIDNSEFEHETIEDVALIMKSSQIKSIKSSNEYLMASKEEIIRFIYSITEEKYGAELGEGAEILKRNQ